MASNRRRNTNPSRRTDLTHPTEILTPPTKTTIQLDEFKKSYKRWKALTHKIGITVDPNTSFINASDAWWTEQEFGCKLTKSLNRKPLVFWDVMQRCLVLHDVQSQSQHFARQRREQLIHEHGVDEEGEDYSDSDSGNMPQIEVPETLEEEEVYRVTIDDDEIFQNSAARRQQRVVHEEVGDDNPLKQQYKTASLASENSNDKVFNNFVLYFIDIAASTDEDKVQLLEAMSGVSRNNQDMPKQLGSDHSFGSPDSGGISSGSPSSVGNNLGGQNSPGFWGPIYPQWGTPPNVAQWETQPNTPQWGTPPNAQWSTSPNVPQWGISPNAPQWRQTENFQQGGSSGTTPTNVQYGFSVGGQGDGATTETPPIIQQTSSSGLGFINYFETGQMPQTPRPGGFFNIWGTPQGSNASHHSDVGDED
ncbi:unnamed protein product [Arabidopsis thaliana]|uniref:Myb/SANT-like domain-containing protein n=1 Tax=Arabidopsis thaliana TaxID=3702 RepID=A0A5S9XHQ2_ARATH|nr:unnamed protein product [Arabidopsis thaliana]